MAAFPFVVSMTTVFPIYRMVVNVKPSTIPNPAVTFKAMQSV
jgi:hypothetical protein